MAIQTKRLRTTPPKISANRLQLLSGLPVNEQQLDLAGISTALLVGGEGAPVILLHGPGETSLWWMRVIPKLVNTHRVIVPDLPGHGSSSFADGLLQADNVLQWLGELIAQTCTVPPILVGHLLGGSIATRFAIRHGELLSHLVLVDSFGLGKFRPSPRFALELIRFMMWPTPKSYDRFLPQCIYDTGELQKKMGNKWDPFLAYNLEIAQNPDTKSALQVLMKKMGVPKIPDEDLAKIAIPTHLIWGRHDRANKVRIAKDASKRYGWPLHIINEARDDPKLERPTAFVEALYASVNTSITI